MMEEKDRLIKIPFANQDSDFCKVIRKFSAMQVIHETLHGENRLPIVMAGDYIGEILNTEYRDENYGEFDDRCKKLSHELNGYRLIHLEYRSIDVDDDGIVWLTVSYHGNSPDLYVPRSVKVLWHRNEALINVYLNEPHENLDIRDLWWFAAFGFAVPVFGSFE